MARLTDNPVVRAVARIPVAVQGKLLAAFAIVVALLVAVGVLGINALDQSNNRVESLGLLPERAAAYQEIAAASYQLNVLLLDRNTAIACVILTHTNICQHATALSSRINLAETDGAINLTLAELGPLTSIGNLSFVPPPEEARIMSQIRTQYVQVDTLVSGLVAGDDTGNPVAIAATIPGSAASGAEYQTTVAATITTEADDLGAIINTATNNLKKQNNASYLELTTSLHRCRRSKHHSGAPARRRPLWGTRRTNQEDTSAPHGDPVRRLFRPHRHPQPRRAGRARDRPQPHERRVGPALWRTRRRQPAQVRVPREHVARVTHPAQCRDRVLRGAGRPPLR